MMSSKLILIEDDDEDLLLEQVAAEAEAALAKRRKVEIAEPKRLPPMEEGAYIAALRGSNSQVWQQNPLNVAGKNRNVGVSAAADIRRPKGGSGSTYGLSEPSVPEKNCPCGLGACVVFTSNTQKNPGRKFYRCPVREENGGCRFFEWCDVESFGANPGTNSYLNSSPNFPDLQCPCGAGICRVFTAKTMQNTGQQFYRCPADQDCGFFKWCNDDIVKSNSPYGSNQNLSLNDSKKTTTRTGSSCFRCGNEGHWARDCTAQASFQPESGNRLRSDTCYKCGKPGHWARDCSSSHYLNAQGKRGLHQ